MFNPQAAPAAQHPFNHTRRSGAIFNMRHTMLNVTREIEQTFFQESVEIVRELLNAIGLDLIDSLEGRETDFPHNADKLLHVGEL